MDTSNRKWIEEAVAQCVAASRSKVVILISRRRIPDEDSDAFADVVMTNAETAEMVTALSQGLAADDDED